MIGSIWSFADELIADAETLAASTEDKRRTLPVSVWVGFAKLGTARGAELLDMLARAGVQRLIFTPTNSAAAADWRWQPARRVLVDGLRAAKERGFQVWLGPWIRCNRKFMRTCGVELARLSAEVGGVDGVELDAEGSFEYTARKAGRKHAGGIPGAVADAIAEFEEHRANLGELSATVLYFNRPAGNALIKLPSVTEVAVQAYSVFWSGKTAKARATQKANFQPGTLQRRAIANYEKFKTDHAVDRLVIGLGWYSQDRSTAPADLRISKKEAFRRASNACLSNSAVDGVNAWALHLWDQPNKATDAEYLQLALEEIRYLSNPADIAPSPESEALAALASTPFPDNPDGVLIHWDRRFDCPEIANGGRPVGFGSVKGLDLDRGAYTDAAKVIRSVCRARGWTRGKCVPFTLASNGAQMIGVYQKHTATYINGRLQTGLDLDGLTVFVSEG